MKNRMAAIVFVAASMGTALSWAVPASAAPQAGDPAEAPSPNGLAVSPPTFDLVARPGEVVHRTVKLQNLSDMPRTVDVSARNFTAKGEEGQADLTSDPTTFAMANWVSVAPSQVQVAPKSEESFDFSVSLPANAEPGGHYGAVVFRSATAPPVAGAVNVAQEVASLILLRVPGEVREAAHVATFTATPQSISSGPVHFEARVANSGNVHVHPTGSVRITDLFGKTVATIPVPGANVLPSSVRRFDVTWKGGQLLGRYKATLTMSFGDSKQRVSRGATFIGFPVAGAVIAVVVLIGLVLLVLRRRRSAR